MIYFIRVALSLITLMIAGDIAFAQWKTQASGTTADFRGLSVVSSNVAWASGSQGTFARTTDGGATWHTGIVAGAAGLDFRDVDAIDEKTAYLLSIGKGELSRIYKTTDGGKRWTLQFTNNSAEAFFDAMAFWDRDNGLAMSDPVNGRFLIITTSDGGATWNQVPAANIPPAIAGEGGFAASGTCIAVQGKNNAWFGTGGSRARVFRSTDRGRTWMVATTPIISGVESAGIFSIAFKDASNGIVVGGDYKKPDQAIDSVARTTDGGRSWKLVGRAHPSGYRSCVAYVPGTQGRALVAVGTSGSDYSVDGGATWASLDKSNYNSVGFAREGSAGWAVGPLGRIAKFEGALPGKLPMRELRK